MCAIIGSFSIDKLKELIELNSYRGSHSFSITIFDTNTSGILSITKSFGKPKGLDRLIEGDDLYYIAHIQAPTQGLTKDFNRIHPSEYSSTHLFHNGILKDKFLKGLGYNGWDTKLLHQIYVNTGNLDSIDGAFSCLHIDNGITLFRNSTSPMFFDDSLNISSTKFKDSTNTQYNKIYQMNFDTKSLDVIKEFNNINEPYFFI